MKKKIEKKIGAQLQKRRTDLGITRYRVSKDTGIHYGYLRDLEDGKRSMSLNMLNRLCEALGLEIKLEPREDTKEVQE